MMQGIEGTAEVLTGGLMARAVEPDTGVDASGHTTERACLNCRTPLAGTYCHVCGQHGHVHRTVGSLLHDLAHGVFHFEGKIWRTLPMLAWCPGEVTRRYIAGERARFVSPLALFLFSVFLLAAVLGNLPNSHFLDNLGEGITRSQSEFQREERELTAEQVALKKEMLQPALSLKRRAEIERRLPRLEQDIEGLRRFQSDDPIEISAGGSDTDMALTDNLNERWRKAKQNPQLLIYKLKTSAYKYSWVLVPMSLPFVWLLFPFSRRFGMYDHAIFTIYSLASLSLLAILLAVVMQVPALGSVGALAFLVLPPLHMYRQLRGAYSLGRLSAIVRTIPLVFFATLALSFWAMFLVTVGAA